MLTKVVNLATEQVIEFSMPPKDAVVSAYAYSIGDMNTWDYKKYESMIIEGEYTVAIGDLVAMKEQKNG